MTPGGGPQEQLGRERKIHRMLDCLDACRPEGKTLLETLDGMTEDERTLLDKAANGPNRASGETWRALRDAAASRDRIRALLSTPAKPFWS